MVYHSRGGYGMAQIGIGIGMEAIWRDAHYSTKRTYIHRNSELGRQTDTHTRAARRSFKDATHTDIHTHARARHDSEIDSENRLRMPISFGDNLRLLCYWNCADGNRLATSTMDCCGDVPIRPMSPSTNQIDILYTAIPQRRRPDSVAQSGRAKPSAWSKRKWNGSIVNQLCVLLLLRPPPPSSL